MAKVLVVGGAGYVGSAAAAWLIDHGHSVWILDDLSTGHLELVRALGLEQRFTRAKAGDRAAVQSLLQQEKFDCAMHFAARSLVGESVQKPAEYFENNVDQTRVLLNTLLDAGVDRLIFSSTCAIFGDPGAERIHEGLPKKPLNPYGETKLEAERLMAELACNRGLKAIALRYFNAAGTEPKLRVGEWHENETHLIPRILQSAAADTPLEIYGTDYPTPDGTCVRDYIHVSDLAAAHMSAMNKLLKEPSPGFWAYNLGSENGFSVREVIQACEKILGRKLPVVTKPRRAGDPPMLVADSILAKTELGFKVQDNALQSIIESASAWFKKLSSSPKKSAIFLDRDGTINEDPGYLSHPDQMKLLPGVGDALAELQKSGYLLVVVSNQSGIGRGLIDPSVLPQIHARLDELLSPYGVRIDHYELCIHHPEEGCECRKPKPKLLTDASRKLGIDLARSFMVGDKISDIDAGKAAGVRGSGLVRSGEGAKAETLLKPGQADFIGDSLADISGWILKTQRH